MLSCDLRRMIAVALVLTTTLITMPVSAADLTAPRPVLGSISTVGSVQVRGLTISQEGTLFSGDSVRTSESGTANVVFARGNKIALDKNAEVQVTGDPANTRVLLAAGNIGFTAVNRNPLRVAVQPFEIIASDASGSVAVMNSGVAGVRALSGKVTVRNLKTAEQFVLTKGEERLLFTTTGRTTKPLAEIASTQPVPIPTRAPQTPAGQTGGLAMDTGAWVAVIAGAAVAGVAITGLIIALNNKDNIDESNSRSSALESQFSTLQGRVGTLTTSVNTLGTSLSTLQTAISVLQSLSAIQANANLAANSLLQAQVAVQASTTLSQAQKNTLIAGLQTQLNEAVFLQSSTTALGTGSPTQVAANLAAAATLAARANTFLPPTGGPARAAITAVNTAGVTVPQIPNTTAAPPPQSASPFTPIA